MRAWRGWELFVWGRQEVAGEEYARMCNCSGGLPWFQGSVVMASGSYTVGRKDGISSSPTDVGVVTLGNVLADLRNAVTAVGDGQSRTNAYGVVPKDCSRDMQA